jgi:hypothetical protein
MDDWILANPGMGENSDWRLIEGYVFSRFFLKERRNGGIVDGKEICFATRDNPVYTMYGSANRYSAFGRQWEPSKSVSNRNIRKFVLDRIHA